jgi:hypothetical protein
MLVHEGIAGD